MATKREVIICKECGEEEELHYFHNEKLKARSLCFSCDFWTDYVESDPLNPNAIVINGGHFIIGDEAYDGAGIMRGFAGRKFIIEKFSGECIVTTNLWHQGKIPERFRGRLPDNARFRRN